MKILHILGENDYDALTFESVYDGQHVDQIIKKLEKGEELVVPDEEDEEYNLAFRIIDVPDIVISREFRDFIKNDLLDYDAGKHSNFYLATDIIKK